MTKKKQLSRKVLAAFIFDAFAPAKAVTGRSNSSIWICLGSPSGRGFPDEMSGDGFHAPGLILAYFFFSPMKTISEGMKPVK